jgi:hypothetical protein
MLKLIAIADDIQPSQAAKYRDDNSQLNVRSITGQSTGLMNINVSRSRSHN